MKIEINNERKIFAIQEEFSNSFPNFKIAFHEKPNTHDGPASEKLVKSSSKTIAECRTIRNSGSISITSGMSVGELKQHMVDIFGLTIEIFTKSENGNQNESPVDETTILEEQNIEDVIPRNS